MTDYSKRPHVVIIGGGLAGIATALRLIKDVRGRSWHLSLVESRREPGLGIAYSTTLSEHLVNGPAQMFSLYEDDAGHFARWLREAGARGGWRPPSGVAVENALPPRMVYADYVRETLAAALAGAAGRLRFTHVRDRAVDLAREADGYRVFLHGGDSLRAGAVVLATGVFPRAAHRHAIDVAPAAQKSPRYVADPWSPMAWNGAGVDQTIAFLGGGLSMVDGVIAAEKAGFRGSFVVLSRHGLPVQERRAAPPWDDFLHYDPEGADLRDILRQIRRERRRLAAEGEDWQRLVPAIRQHVPALWRAASPQEKRRFLRRVRPYWETALHRSAPEPLAWIERARRMGRHRQLAATVLSVSLDKEHRFRVRYRPRGEEREVELVADRIVGCLGFEHDWTRIDDPLVRNLLERGLVSPDPLGFGIQATRDNCAVLDARGAALPRLHAVGHPLRGVFWESNAIPEQVPEAGLAARDIAHWIDVAGGRGPVRAAASEDPLALA